MLIPAAFKELPHNLRYLETSIITDEVLIFSLDSNAFIDWWQVITKNQNSINDDGYNLSIATLVKKDMIYIFLQSKLS